MFVLCDDCQIEQECGKRSQATRAARYMCSVITTTHGKTQYKPESFAFHLALCPTAALLSVGFFNAGPIGINDLPKKPDGRDHEEGQHSRHAAPLYWRPAARRIPR